MSELGAVMATGGTLTLSGDTSGMHVESVDIVGPKYDTFQGREPDPRWMFADAQGHEHRWMVPLGEKDFQKAVIPTAVRATRHVECDGTGLHFEAFCEGYEVVEWHCVQCGEEVRPEYRSCQVSVKRNEGHFEVTVQWEPEPVDGVVTWNSSSGERARDARLVWPAAPGRMLDLGGRVWERGGPSAECGSGGRAVFHRRFVFVPSRGA